MYAVLSLQGTHYIYGSFPGLRFHWFNPVWVQSRGFNSVGSIPLGSIPCGFNSVGSIPLGSIPFGFNPDGTVYSISMSCQNNRTSIYGCFVILVKPYLLNGIFFEGVPGQVQRGD